ncbi:MAG: hypothetical protein ABEN55_10715 [Bradymonadaceae bacterium]
MNTTIHQIVRGDNLSLTESKALFDDLFAGNRDDAEILTLLAALNSRPETASELAGATLALRSAMGTTSPPRLPATRVCNVDCTTTGAILDTTVALAASELDVSVLVAANDPLGDDDRPEAYRQLDVPVCIGERDGLDALRRRKLAAVYDRQLRRVNRRAVGAGQFGPANILTVASAFARPVRAGQVLCEVPSADLCAPLARTLALLGYRQAAVLATDGPVRTRLAHLRKAGEVVEQTIPLPVRTKDVRHHALPNSLHRGVRYLVGDQVPEDVHRALAYRTALLALAGEPDEPFGVLFDGALKCLESGRLAPRFARSVRRWA